MAHVLTARDDQAVAASERVRRLTDADILCISSIDWDFNWQGHQEVMSALAAQGNRVLFVENTGVRTPRLSDMPRLKRRLLNWWKGTKGFRQERANLYVYSPLVLPLPNSPFARWINRALLERALTRWTRAMRTARPIVWTFLPTRLVVDLIDRLDPELVVYYCIADFAQLVAQPRALAVSERMLLDRSDVVFVQGEELRQRCLPHANVHIFPFGVNLAVFGEDGEPAPEVSGLPRPIIGYVGGLHRHVDVPLLERLARECDGTLLLVGPAQIDTSALEHLPNVVLTGAQPHARVPEFIRAFDVGIVPYVHNDYTRTVYPTKLNEYLAMGVPVVATDLPEITKFAAANRGVIDVAGNAEAFIAAVRRSSGARGAADVARRQEVARSHGWEQRIEQMSALVAEARAARRAARDRWDERLLRLYSRARRHSLNLAGGALIALVLAFYSPLPWWIAAPLYVAEPPRAADAIVVFGGGVGESGVAGGGYQERVKRAVDLYHEGRAAHVVFSSGFVWAFREAEVMRNLAIDFGVPPEAIVLETKAANTYENVTNVHQILATHGWRSILLVTSPYHTRRALLTFRKQAPGLAVTSVPVTNSQFYSHGWGASVGQIRGILHEYAAIVAYRWRGRL